MKIVVGMEVGLSPGDFMLDGVPAFLPKKGAEPPPKFSAHFYCGQTAGYIKMPLGMEAGLIPGDLVFDGNPPRQKGGGARRLYFHPVVSSSFFFYFLQRAALQALY